MKRLVLSLLCIAALLDIAQQAYSIGLAASIASAPVGNSILTIFAHSSIVRSFESWGMFFLAFTVLAFAMSIRPSAKPDQIGRSRS